MLGETDLTLPSTPPPTPAAIARFDYIELVAQDTAVTGATDTANLVTRWTWRPRLSSYQDDYTATVALRDSTGAVLAEWDFRLGGDRYPSSQWASGYAVIQEERLPLPSEIAPGDYRLSIAIRRTSDDLPIPAAGRWPWQSASQLDIATVSIP